MQLFLRFPEKTSCMEAHPSQTIGSIKQRVGALLNFEPSNVVLSHNALLLNDSVTLSSYGISNMAVINVGAKCVGGGGNMSENDTAMAMQRNIAMICRSCNVRLPIRAVKCRKCGKKDLRPQKINKNPKKA